MIKGKIKMPVTTLSAQAKLNKKRCKEKVVVNAIVQLSDCRFGNTQADRVSGCCMNCVFVENNILGIDLYFGVGDICLLNNVKTKFCIFEINVFQCNIRTRVVGMQQIFHVIFCDDIFERDVALRHTFATGINTACIGVMVQADGNGCTAFFL